MSLLLGQLVYTSFPRVGFKTLVSAEVPTQIKQAFIQQIVYQHWNSYKPPRAGYLAAYVYQITLEHNLFGWLYNDGMDDLGRSHIPYFLCYYLAERLNTAQLANIFTCLQRGPVGLIERLNFPSSLDPIVFPNLWSYLPARKGLEIPLSVREQSYISLKQEKLLNLFVPSDQREIVVELNAQNSPALTAVALRPEAVMPLASRKSYAQALRAVVTIIVVGVIFALLKSWQPSAPPINLSKAQLQKQTKENNIVSIQPHRSVPGFPTGTPESIVKAALGEPTKTSKGYLPNIDVAFYDLVSHQITLGYLFDRYSRRIRKTEVSFAQSIDSQVMLATLNGLLGHQAPEEIQQALQQVHQRQFDQYPVVVGSLEGIIKRNNRDRIYIGLWETNLH